MAMVPLFSVSLNAIQVALPQNPGPAAADDDSPAVAGLLSQCHRTSCCYRRAAEAVDALFFCFALFVHSRSKPVLQSLGVLGL